MCNYGLFLLALTTFVVTSAKDQQQVRRQPSKHKERTTPSSLGSLTSIGNEVTSYTPSINFTNIAHSTTKQPLDRINGWSQWSDWSLCSRSCDGGVSRQLRTCSSTSGCKGEQVRYKICNMQPCGSSVINSSGDLSTEEDSWRATQCSTYDHLPYEGVLYFWYPHRDDAEPCSLTCRGLSQHSGNSNNVKVDLQVTSEDDEAVVIAVLSPRVQDGTRCRPGSLDMCIDGVCQRVGCDLRVGSTRRVDACGICGGDGSACARPRYHWDSTSASLCSATCGGGYKMSLAVCRDRVSGSDVDEQLCDGMKRPASNVVKCNTHACPYNWYVGDWSTCSATCGGGKRVRRVICARYANGSGAVPSNENTPCRGPAPKDSLSCAEEECPQWHTGQWSGCSVSCGNGMQVREVHCTNKQIPDPEGIETLKEACDNNVKPELSRICTTGIACITHLEITNDNEDDIEELLPGLVYHTQPLIQPYPPIQAKAEKLIGEQITPSDATFIKDTEWSPCSGSCGEGFRKREVHCKIFLEFSRTIAKLPDHKCTGPKPPDESERCIMEPCSMAYGTSYGDSNPPAMLPENARSIGFGDPGIRVAPGVPGKSYSWKEQGYTHCSASCLGGVQELIVNCIRDDSSKIASPYMCDPDTKPENRVRTCNDHPCPPRWNYTDFAACTKTCGIGIQTREVNCIHEVTRGGGNTVVVPNNMCPQPPPSDRQYCNVLDCPINWTYDKWSKCSKQCGGGIKERKVECKQIMAQSHVIDRHESMCPQNKKPESRKPCNTKQCVLDTSTPEITISDTSYIQHDPTKKKVTVKIGGSALLFQGTNLKIRCPVKGYNRTKIQWAKDHIYLVKSKKFKTSKKGALSIMDLLYRDKGIYTCIAGRSTADINITIKARPGEKPSPEELQLLKSNPLSDLNSNNREGVYRPFVASSEDQFSVDSPYNNDHEDRLNFGYAQKMGNRGREGETELNYRNTDGALITITGSDGTQRSGASNTTPAINGILMKLQVIWLISFLLNLPESLTKIMFNDKVEENRLSQFLGGEENLFDIQNKLKNMYYKKKIKAFDGFIVQSDINYHDFEYDVTSWRKRYKVTNSLDTFDNFLRDVTAKNICYLKSCTQIPYYVNITYANHLAKPEVLNCNR